MDMKNGFVRKLIQQFEEVPSINIKIKKTVSWDGFIQKSPDIIPPAKKLFKESENCIESVNNNNYNSIELDLKFDLTAATKSINRITSLAFYEKCIYDDTNVYYDYFGQELIDDLSENVIEAYNFDVLESYLCNANNNNLLSTEIIEDDVVQTNIEIKENDIVNFDENSIDEVTFIKDDIEIICNCDDGNNNRDTLEDLRINLEAYENYLKTVPDYNRLNKSENHDISITLSDNLHSIIIDEPKIQNNDDHIYDAVDECFDNSEHIYQTLEDCKKSSLTKTEMIVRELIETEKNYLSTLESIIKDYMDYFDDNSKPSHLIGRSSYLFGNIKIIYEQSLIFYDELLKCNYDWKRVAETFVKHKHLFELYSHYSKNKPKADEYIQNYFFDMLEERRKDLNQQFDLASNLLAPIQRLTKYKLLLENIKKELYKIGGKNISQLSIAINLIKEELNKGNDYIAIDDIKEWPSINKMELGAFIMRDVFMIRNPRKFESMIFLFDKILIFTIKDNNQSFIYKEGINLSEMGIAIMDYDPLEFHIIQYAHNKMKKKKKKKETYMIEAKSPSVKEMWTKQIHYMLTEQFKEYKRNQIIIYQQEGKRCSNRPL